MRWGVVGVAACVIAGCGFKAPGEGDDGGDIDGDASAMESITETDFSGGTLTDGVTVASGGIEPAAFVGSALHVRFFRNYTISATTTLMDGNTPAFASLEAALDGKLVDEAYLSPSALQPRNANVPFGLDLNGGCQECTFLWDGEVFLTQRAASVIHFYGDDESIVRIRIGESEVSRYSHNHEEVAPPVEVPHDGWYPITIAQRQTGGGMRVSVAQDTSADAPLADDRFRARAETQHGLLLTAFREFSEPRNTTLVASLEHGYDVAPEGNLDAGDNHLTLRYAGQILIAADAEYTFSFADTPDYYRLFIDDQYIAGKQLVTKQPAGTITLSAGWHSIVVDDFNTDARAEVKLTIGTATSGPRPIASAELRPIAMRGLSTLMTTADFNVAEGAPVTVLVTPTLVAGTTIEYADVNFVASNDQDARATVAGCGSAALEVPHTSVMRYAQLEQAPLCAGKPVDSSSALTVVATDPPGGGGSRIESFRAFFSYHGGPSHRPLPDVVVYESRDLATPGATQLATLVATTSPSTAADRVALFVRSAADPAALHLAPWQAVSPNGAIVGVTAGAVSQYRVELTTDGWVPVSLTSITLAYTRDRSDERR